MQTVGRIGSYISKSVYTVSGTFHPFGGAVDIIVVEQPDGSYKASPWYVRFGKFQGVLKTKVKVVGIRVNDVDSGLHMHLDSNGEAFFMQEVDVEEGESEDSPSSSGEDMDGPPRWPLKSKSCNYDSNLHDPLSNESKVLARANTRQSQFFGFFGRRSPAEEAVQGKENAPDVKGEGSLEVAEMAADLLDLRWSTNLASSKRKKDDASSLSVADTSKKEVIRNSPFDGSCQNETSLISERHCQELKTAAEVNGVEIKCVTSEYVVSTSGESAGENSTLSDSEPLMTGTLGLDKPSTVGVVHEEKISVTEGTSCGASKSIVTECYSQLVCRNQSNDPLTDVDSQSIEAASTLSYSTSLPMDEQNNLADNDELDSSAGPLCDHHIRRCISVPPCSEASRISQDELLVFRSVDDFGPPEAKPLEFGQSDHEGKATDLLFSSRVTGLGIESSDAKCCSSFSLDQSDMRDCPNDVVIHSRRLSSISSDVCINEIGNVQSEGPIRTVRSLPSMVNFCSNHEPSDPDYFSNASLIPCMDSCTKENHQVPGAGRTAKVPDKPGYPPRSMDTLGGSVRYGSVPSRRSGGITATDVMNAGENLNGLENPNKSSDLETETDVTKVKVHKKKVRTLTPTSRQLASLNLKEGKNTVIFTFSTAMLGNQQVDARIFLWRWDAKIVISDVDGTITRSDLLGQVMPLVGMDWSQTGVAHLFTAIKENGYQLLFLSARSISQSYITRQFLLNIKQDGKALPEGPVVISPDGLFPSLFREVVRRAPHEFKISCLEDIKALFPPDRNPFYAGFGNRDTDEVSYLKVGIPRGKIFIINPKGEIAVNRRVDTKSYVTLHSLVHGMFPHTFTCEQEDFNSWNYWKLPPPSIEF